MELATKHDTSHSFDWPGSSPQLEFGGPGSDIDGGLRTRRRDLRDRSSVRYCQQHDLYLWTALPLQVNLDLYYVISGKHLSGVSRLAAAAPKWLIRTRAPQQMVGLKDHYKSQAYYASVRSVQSISSSTRNL